MWTAPGEIVVDREPYTVQSPKFILTVMWNPIEFHVLKALPKGRKFNTQYYTNYILVAISGWRRQTGGTGPNKLWVYSDNARPHTAKMSRDYIGSNQMKQAPHPPYSPDLAPSDFSFLVTSKESWWDIALKLHLNFLFVFGLFWRKSCGRP
jgi:histone-lysine N-methyltransferase SETMAR